LVAAAVAPAPRSALDLHRAEEAAITYELEPKVPDEHREVSRTGGWADGRSRMELAVSLVPVHVNRVRFLLVPTKIVVAESWRAR
jgi:hypothetical protein